MTDIAAFRPTSRRGWIHLGVGVAILACLVLATAATLSYTPPTKLGGGNVTSEAAGETVVSIQGFHFEGQGSTKKPARLVTANESASTKWKYEPDSARWFYDVDPLSNGNLLVVSTAPGRTLVYEYNPETRERIWEEEFDFEDTHDVDLINENELLIANMREYENGVSNDRLLIYNRTTEEIEWEWKFRDYYPNSTAGGFNEDWTHVNDVDKIGEGRYLASPRNFDQSIIVNRSTGNIEERLGEDGNHRILHKQHNPDYLETEDGQPVILVADSDNNRVVEYTKEEDIGWNKTWSVTGFNWPRDADRLPNGNTLVTDTLNHRVIEITPDGHVVWEYNATWAPYDAERPVHGGGSNGPTMHDLNVNGNYTVKGASPTASNPISKGIRAATHGTPLAASGKQAATAYQHVSPWIKPVWMPHTAVGYLGIGALLALISLFGEGVIRVRRLTLDEPES